MGKIIKLISMLAVVFLLIVPASAYTFINAGSNDVQLKYSSSEAKSLAGSGATAAAQAAVDFANDNGLTVNRSVESVRNEIKAHAAAYVAGIMRSRANPMDLVMSEGEWDWFWAAID